MTTVACVNEELHRRVTIDQRLYLQDCAINRSVVNEKQFVELMRQVLENFRQPLIEFIDVPLLVVAREHNAYAAAVKAAFAYRIGA